MHIRLDAIGGIAGDMFIAALLDAFPDLESGLYQTLRSAGVPAEVTFQLLAYRDHALTGRRFAVGEPLPDSENHHHSSFRYIRAHIRDAAIGPGIRQRALAIYSLLAEAEAQVHGVGVDDVTFHELGSWDSIVDILGAAYLLDALPPATWSVSSLPLGGGSVQTAHGRLPVPAPATVLLARGLIFHDDDIPGERVTPTGAAILRYLDCAKSPLLLDGRLFASGIGFGTRELPGLSNVLRVMAFEALESKSDTDRVAILSFEVDDQRPEDLGVALARLRDNPDVIDVVQIPALGKKNRLVMQIQVLAIAGRLPSVIDACFRETATIGIRHQVVDRTILRRTHASVEVNGLVVQVKLVDRPGAGRTAKAEMDDVAAAGEWSKREIVARAAEAKALDQGNES